MKERLLVFINYFGKTSETFIADEIEFLSKQDAIDLSVLHYGSSIPKKNIAGLSMPSSLMKRLRKAPQKLNISALKSLKYKNGLNGSLSYLIAFFKKNQFDTIYCHFGTNGKLIAQLKAIGVIPSQTKIIVRFHGLDMLFSKYPIGFYDILNKYTSKIIVGSEYAFSTLLSYNINKELLVKLPVGIKKENISVKSSLLLSNPCQIISVGRLIDLKGHFQALDIVKLLRDQNIDFKFTIIGDGPLYSSISEKIKEYKLEQKVELIQSLTHKEVLERLETSHIYLYAGIKDNSGRVEAQGLANLESMAKGLVIVASDIGGVSDYVLTDKTGFLCQAESIQEFVKKLTLVIREFSSEEIKQIRQNAIEIVSDNYCQENLNKELIKLLID